MAQEIMKADGMADLCCEYLKHHNGSAISLARARIFHKIVGAMMEADRMDGMLGSGHAGAVSEDMRAGLHLIERRIWAGCEILARDGSPEASARTHPHPKQDIRGLTPVSRPDQPSSGHARQVWSKEQGLLRRCDNSHDSTNRHQREARGERVGAAAP
jgi:hypothetical protein